VVRLDSENLNFEKIEVLNVGGAENG